ncbi:MAG: hypothetical protein K2M03_07570 [Muribaculaceae bacterium]|nr:hypothetical protein [Muribaculaceae bacterium]
MNLPLISVSQDNSIKDIRGENVKIFINGNEATDLDLSAFWPKDVTRVEYYTDPTDPIYKGYKGVLNFVMPVYAAGGVTKIDVSQMLSPYGGMYDVSSKLVYKRMTYGLGLDAMLSNDNNTFEEQTSYKDVWYANKRR